MRTLRLHFITASIAIAACPLLLANGVKADFNGDGRGDLAVGVPDETLNGRVGAGGVNIFYGSANGLTPGPFLSQDSPNCPGVAEVVDGFGHALATGDFNNDGYADLAIGAPYEDDENAGLVDVGVVHVLFGSATGLSCTGSQLFSQASISGGVPVEDAWFGEALAVGDFNHDGYSDLAIGARGDVVSGVGHAGSVTVLYGSSTGLKTSGAKRFTLNSTGVVGVAAVGDGFGYSLAAGNFGKGAWDDLAIGIPFKTVSNQFGAGAVSIIYGSASGLSASSLAAGGGGNQYFTQDTPGVLGIAEAGSEFGIALAAGNLGKSGYYDLAIGADNVATLTGAVHILYGSDSGLTTAGTQIFFGPSANSRYGHALVAADFGYTNHHDLAIGAPGRSSGAGAVYVLYGTDNGLSGANAQTLSLGFGSAANDQFGDALAAANYGGDGHADLAIGIPGRKVGTQAGAGAVAIRFGSTTGLSSGQLLTQDTPGVPDPSEAGDHFGSAVSR